jgi:hypothetical protein
MEAPRPATALVAIAQQREIAEVQAAMIVARSSPRDEKVAQDRILMACTRPALAEKAMYAYSRGGTEVTGPSIRLAEVLAQNWGNFDFGIRELEQRDGESTVEAYAWDMETNVRQRKVFQVPHLRYTKAKGNVTLSDPRDIYEMVANQGARRLRACILGVIPGDVQEAAVQQCEATLKAKADVTPERLKVLLEKFAEFGVTKEMVERRMQRHLEAMTPGMLVQFGKIYNSIKDGVSTPAEWFSQAAGPEKGSLSPEDLKPAAEGNRGHGDENLGAAAKGGKKAATATEATRPAATAAPAEKSRAEIKADTAEFVDGIDDHLPEPARPATPTTTVQPGLVDF